MNRFIKFILVLSANYFCLIPATGQTAIQTAIPATGGTATGSGGTSTYTVGQVFYITIPGTSGSVAQGVQQPWEISVVTAIEKTEGITLGMKVYPNPAADILTLTIDSFEYKDLKYMLYDMNGMLLQEKKIEDNLTEIPLLNYSSTMYLLRIVNNKQEIKVFKIVKN